MNKELNNNEIWSRINPQVNSKNIYSLNENIIYDDEEEEEELTEVRAWSTYKTMDSENILGESLTKQEKSQLLSSSSNRNELREDIRGIDKILNYIDNRRPPRQKRNRLNYKTFIGTMSGLEQIYHNENFLKDFEEFRSLFIYIDSVFRGIGQVMFCNNSLSGLIITIGLFIGNWELTLYGLLGTSISTLTAHIFGFNYDSIRAGLFGYNGCLTGMGITYFSYSHSPQMIGPVIIMSIFSTIFAMAIGKILVQRIEISPFTFSFQICVWIWLLGSLKYRYYFINGTILSPNLLNTFIIKPSLSNISIPEYTVKDNFRGFFSSISQVYFIDNPYTGAIILVGVCICSRILSFFALFGSITSQLSAAYLLGLPVASINAGLWGYNSVLTCQALGGMFFVLSGYRIWLFTLYGSIMTVLVQGAVSSFLNSCGMPTLTFPFTLICWIFCLIAGSKNLISVKLTAVSIPEDHYRRFKLSCLVKKEFKYLNNLIDFSLSSDNVDITWEEFLKIQKIFVPILICSYVYHNDFKNFKKLIKQNININSVDQNNRNLLHISSSQGNYKLTKWIIKNIKINFNLIDNFGHTPLYDALWNGHYHLLSLLYSYGARFPSSKSKELAFYLNGFIYQNNIQGIQCLLSCGFNPNTSDYDGRNALHIAVITNQFHIVQYLVENFSIWLDIKDYFQETAINYALRLTNLTIANYLLEKKKNYPIPLNISKDKSKFLQIIIENNIENNKKEEIQTTIDENLLTTLFSMIASQNDQKLMKKFLNENPNLNIIQSVDYDYRSVGHVAAVEGRIETIQFLSEQFQFDQFQIMMNKEDRWGLTPIDEAYRHKNYNIIQFYKQYLNIHSNQIKNNHIQINIENENENNSIIYSLKKWNKVFLFCSLAASGSAEHIQSLFDRNYFIPTELYEDYHHRTPAHFAAANGHFNVIQLLIKYGYNGIIHPNRWGFYPIDQARQMNFQQIVDQLMQIKF